MLGSPRGVVEANAALVGALPDHGRHRVDRADDHQDLVSVMRKVATAKPRSMARQVRDDYGTRPGDGHRRSRQHHRFARCAAAAWFVRFAFELHGDGVAPMSLGPKPSDPPVPTGDRPSLLFTVRGLASAEIVRPHDLRAFRRAFTGCRSLRLNVSLNCTPNCVPLVQRTIAVDQPAGGEVELDLGADRELVAALDQCAAARDVAQPRAFHLP